MNKFPKALVSLVCTLMASTGMTVEWALQGSLCQQSSLLSAKQ